MPNASCLLRMGENNEENAKIIIDFVIEQLVQKSDIVHDIIHPYGVGVEAVTKPWAMVICKDMSSFQSMLHSKTSDISHSNTVQRKWLNLIRICQIDTIHQLRGLISGLQMINAISKNTRSHHKNILTWIAIEKDGQPPALIVIVDLLDLLISGISKNDYDQNDPLRYLTLRLNELSQVLIILKETCNYLSTSLRKEWENAIGLSLGYSTDILITDRSCLPDNNGSNRLQSIYNILNYYLDSVI